MPLIFATRLWSPPVHAGTLTRRSLPSTAAEKPSSEPTMAPPSSPGTESTYSCEGQLRIINILFRIRSIDINEMKILFNNSA